MKKLISVVLAAVLMLTCLSAIAFAAEGDGFTHVYTVRVAPASEGAVRVVGVESADNTVVEGRTFYFTIEYERGYAPDVTVQVKCYPASYPGELVGTDKDVASTLLTPDAYGVYSIPNVREDYYVGVYNVTETQFASLKTMLINLFETIINFFKRMFNR